MWQSITSQFFATTWNTKGVPVQLLCGRGLQASYSQLPVHERCSRTPVIAIPGHGLLPWDSCMRHGLFPTMLVLFATSGTRRVFPYVGHVLRVLCELHSLSPINLCRPPVYRLFYQLFSRIKFSILYIWLLKLFFNQ